MTIVTDSYMTMILPENISERISAFLCHKQNFPFIHSNELTCIFFLYGRKWKVNGENEYKQAIDLADQTYRKISKDIEVYNNRNSKMDVITEFARSSYINRGLQIMVESKNNDISGEERMFADPAILLDCFARHVAYHHQDFFFQVYGPLKDSELTKDMHHSLSGRMVMIGYNRMDEKSLPFHHPLIPLYIWMRESTYLKTKQSGYS
jgi:hypothetical protein